MKYLETYKLFESALIDWINQGTENDMIEKMIRSAKNMNKLDDENFYGETPLSKAIDRNNFYHVRLLVDAGADINYINKHGDITFSDVEDLDILKYLVKCGIDIDFINPPNKTILMNTIRDGNNDLFYFLIDIGADLTIKDSDGQDFLDFFENDGEMEDMLEYLKKNRPNDYNKYLIDKKRRDFNL